MSLSLSYLYPGSGVYLIVSIPDLCTITYLVFFSTNDLVFFLIFKSISWVIKSHILKTRGENAISSHRVSREPHDEPIHNALVLSTLMFNPDIV